MEAFRGKPAWTLLFSEASVWLPEACGMPSQYNPPSKPQSALIGQKVIDRAFTGEPAVPLPPCPRLAGFAPLLLLPSSRVSVFFEPSAVAYFVVWLVVPKRALIFAPFTGGGLRAFAGVGKTYIIFIVFFLKERRNGISWYFSLTRQCWFCAVGLCRCFSYTFLSQNNHSF